MKSSFTVPQGLLAANQLRKMRPTADEREPQSGTCLSEDNGNKAYTPVH
jgi:hypothetical protein